MDVYRPDLKKPINMYSSGTPPRPNSQMSKPFLYYAGIVSYLLFALNVEVSWDYPTFPFKYLTFFLLSAHLFQVISLYSIRHQILLLLSLLLVCIVGVIAEQLAPLILSFELIVGAKGVEFKKILKVHFLVSVAICLFSVIGSSVGLVENVVVDLSNEVDLFADSPKRYSYGYVWPTGCAIHISFLCLTYWLIKDSYIGVKGWLCFIIAIYFVLFYPQARQASFIIFFILLISLYINYVIRHQRHPNRLFLFFLLISPLVFAAISLYMTIAFNGLDQTWMFVDILFTGRLRLGQEAIEEYGIPLFGQYIDMIGGDVNMNDYNYVDSSFVQAPLIWGVVLFGILLLLYEYIACKAYKINSYSLLFAVAIAALSGVTSQYFFQIKFCPLLLALFASHNVRRR